MSRRLIPLVFVLLLGGCVTMPAALQGEFAPVQPGDAARSGAVGVPVRWGGRLVKVEPQADHSCFEIVGLPLDGFGRPVPVNRSTGRFLACRAGFYDPEIFLPGREVTVTGQVTGYEVRRIGEYDYHYPRLAADVIFLWPGYAGAGGVAGLPPPEEEGW